MFWGALVGLLLPIVVVAFNVHFMPEKFRRINIIFLNVVLVYLLMNVGVQLENMYLKAESMKFDLNGNGLLDGREITVEAMDAMSRVAHDTGRTFAPVTTLLYAPIYTLIIYLVLGRFSWFKKEARNSDPRQWDTDFMRRR